MIKLTLQTYNLYCVVHNSIVRSNYLFSEKELLEHENKTGLSNNQLYFEF